MCGINGIAFSSRSEKQINKRVLEKMRDVIFHRGPDDGRLFRVRKSRLRASQTFNRGCRARLAADV